jgi:hypothetical protein
MASGRICVAAHTPHPSHSRPFAHLDPIFIRKADASPVNRCKTRAVSGNMNRLPRSINCSAGGVSIEYVATFMLPAQTLHAWETPLQNLLAKYADAVEYRLSFLPMSSELS